MSVDSTSDRQRTPPTTRLTATLLVAALAGGCAGTSSPHYDSRFGDAGRALRAQQYIAADAPQRNADTLPPTDGRTMREAVDRQVDSFRKPPATQIINIGLGGAGGGG